MFSTDTTVEQWKGISWKSSVTETNGSWPGNTEVLCLVAPLDRCSHNISCVGGEQWRRCTTAILEPSQNAELLLTIHLAAFYTHNFLWIILCFFADRKDDYRGYFIFNAKRNCNEIILNNKRQCQFIFSSDFLHTW